MQSWFNKIDYLDNNFHYINSARRLCLQSGSVHLFLNLFNILMMLNKWIIQWFSIDVTTRSLVDVEFNSLFVSIIGCSHLSLFLRPIFTEILEKLVTYHDLYLALQYCIWQCNIILGMHFAINDRLLRTSNRDILVVTGTTKIMGGGDYIIVIKTVANE